MSEPSDARAEPAGSRSGPTEPAIPLTGAQYHITAGDYQATACELGAGLRNLAHRGRALITGYQPDELPPAGAGQLLAPWPNRIDGGRYEFDGATCQLDLSEAARGNAIHGLTRWADWHPDAYESNAITLTHLLLGRPGYPFCLRLSVTYQLDPDEGLTVTVSAANAGSRPAPYGTGSHPYLTTGASVVDGCELEVPADRWLPTDDRGIPAGAPLDVTGSQFDFRSARPIGDVKLDHALTRLARDGSGRAWVRLSDEQMRLGLWAGPGYDWIQLFTGDGLAPGQRRRALAVEPMTCPANAFVTGVGRLTLDPGASVTHRWGVKVLHP